MGTRYMTSLFLLLWNLTCISLLALGWAFGIVQDVFTQDASHITELLAFLLAVCIVYATYQTFVLDRTAEQIDDGHHAVVAQTLEESMALPAFLKSDVFIYLGLCGTVVGLIIFARHMVVDADHATAEAVTATLAAMKLSMQTAFDATLVGIVCKLWVEVMLFIQEWAVRDIHTASLTRSAT